LAADGPLELDHAAERPARDDRVVDRYEASAAVLDLDRRELDDGVLSGKHAPNSALEGVLVHRAEKPDAAEVDTDHRHPRAEVAAEGAKHGAVTPEDDGDVDRVVVSVDGLDVVLDLLFGGHR